MGRHRTSQSGPGLSLIPYSLTRYVRKRGEIPDVVQAAGREAVRGSQGDETQLGAHQLVSLRWTECGVRSSSGV